jgi:hypothetical protein
MMSKSALAQVRILSWSPFCRCGGKADTAVFKTAVRVGHIGASPIIGTFKYAVKLMG